MFISTSILRSRYAFSNRIHQYGNQLPCHQDTDKTNEDSHNRPKGVLTTISP